MKKSGEKKAAKKTKIPIVPLFWLAFAAVIILLFLINLPKIRETVSATRLSERVGLPFAEETEEAPVNEADSPAPQLNEEDYPSLEDALAELNSAIAQSAAQESTGAAAATGAQETTSRVQRTLYFMRMDNDGILVRTPAKREVAVSSTPLLDAIKTLLQGASSAEAAQGISTLIPAGTAINSAAMRGSTAVLNFNENFMFNSFGAEGYLAQLRQVVWTATEFPSVKNVQILVEGQRIDFLGDNIRVDAPIAREDL